MAKILQRESFSDCKVRDCEAMIRTERKIKSFPISDFCLCICDTKGHNAKFLAANRN